MDRPGCRFRPSPARPAWPREIPPAYPTTGVALKQRVFHGDRFACSSCSGPRVRDSADDVGLQEDVRAALGAAARGNAEDRALAIQRGRHYVAAALSPGTSAQVFDPVLG